MHKRTALGVRPAPYGFPGNVPSKRLVCGYRIEPKRPSLLIATRRARPQGFATHMPLGTGGVAPSGSGWLFDVPFATDIPLERLAMHSHCAPPGCSVVPSGAPASGSTLSSAHSGSIEDLIDRYLGPLYPHYADHTRPMLIRQARDLLVCTFHGDLERFEGHFLRPATDIVRELRCTYQRGKGVRRWVAAAGGGGEIESGEEKSTVQAGCRPNSLVPMISIVIGVFDSIPACIMRPEQPREYTRMIQIW
uniref:Uncharacterized protein n=1 Tax=Anopheles atroparvus TaxID=41427 RepID=A0A182IR70_ANOAO